MSIRYDRDGAFRIAPGQTFDRVTFHSTYLEAWNADLAAVRGIKRLASILKTMSQYCNESRGT